MVSTLNEGDHFGEYSCLLGHPRSSTMVAMEFSELYSLSREDLMEVYRQWPELHAQFLELGKGWQPCVVRPLTRETTSEMQCRAAELQAKQAATNGSSGRGKEGLFRTTGREAPRKKKAGRMKMRLRKVLHGERGEGKGRTSHRGRHQVEPEG